MAEKGPDNTFDGELRAADDLAAAAIRDNVDAVAPERSSPRRGYVGPVVAIACVVLFVSQLPALQAAFQAPPSIRVGDAGADADTEACIDTLWKISSVLQHGSLRDTSMVEPLTQQPYRVRQVDGDTVVECPNPAAHNLHALHVSGAHRAPEAVK